MSKRTLTLASVFLVAACSGDRGVASVTVADSAGVRIVHSHGPEWGDTRPWQISSDATVRIGTVSGAEETLLSRARGSFRLSDGHIVVLDDDTSVRMYDETGVFVRAIGREGEGPGEFSYVSDAWRFGGDSIATFDYEQRIVSRFSPDGEFVRSSRLMGGFVYGFFGELGDGSLLAAELVRGNRTEEGGLTDDAFTLVRYHPDGAVADTLGTGAGFQRSETGPTPFSVGIRRAVTDTRLYLSRGEAHSFRGLDGTGALRSVIRWDGPDRTITDADLDIVREGLRDRYEGDELANRLRAFEAEPHPAEKPAYSSLLVDELGFFWVRRYDVARDNFWTGRGYTGTGGAGEWWVFDPDGVWLGSVDVPEALDVNSIGADWVMGVERDDYDVPQVVVYALAR